MPESGPAQPPTALPDCAAELLVVTRQELAQALADMIDDEIRLLRMRIGVLQARRKNLIRLSN